MNSFQRQRLTFRLRIGACLCALWGTRPAAAELVLVDDGASLAPIVVFADAPPKTRRAADELADYIAKITQVRPEVIEGMPDPMPDQAIWVGYQPVLDGLFPDLDFTFAHPEEILIAAADRHLVIAGRDRWDPEHLVVQLGRSTVVGRQREYGTVNAVYTFLRDYLDVRWLWPGDLGEDVLTQSRIAFEPFVYRYHPQVRSRGGMLAFSVLGNRGYGRSHDWARLQRIQLGSMELMGGHAFTTWWDRFGKTHPEYFALQPDGSRGGGERPYPSARTIKICHSNPAVADQWLEDVAAQLEQDPNRWMFSVSPNDGWANGHCVCQDCIAWDHPEGEMRRFAWQGVALEYVALSDREVTFANRCARLLKERYPDQDYVVALMAYGHSRPPPVAAVPDDNVLISSVANFIWNLDTVDRGSTTGMTHSEQFAGWGGVTHNLAWRPNTGSPAGWQQGQPDVPFGRIIKHFRYAADHNKTGIFIDMLWEHWGTQGPLYYMMAHLVWDPSLDGRAILDDFYQRAGGPAAAPIKAYWELLEATREDYVSGDRAYPEVYDAAFFARASGYLDAADALVAEAPERYRQRVDFFRAGLTHTRLVIELRDLMARYRSSSQTDQEAATRARANWEQIEANARDYPIAINWGPVRPGTPRMRNLNPDA